MPNIVRGVPPLDDTDRVILTALVEDGRTPNNALAERAGAVVSATETILFDWLHRAGTPEFKAISALVR